MPEDTSTGNTSFIERQGTMSKAATGMVVHVMAVVAIMVFATICLCELIMCAWHMYQKDYNYVVPNELWLIATGISSFLFGKRFGETNPAKTTP